MTVLRQEFQISVEGADAAAAALGRTAAAMNSVNEAAIRDRIAIGDAEAAIVKKIRAEQAHRQAIEDVLKPTTEAAKQTGFFAKASSSASGALTLLRKAAELIPGMELGTIFAGIAEGAYEIYKAFDGGADSMANQTKALEVQATAARQLAAAQRSVLESQIGAGVSGAQAALARLGSGATQEAIAEVIRISAQRTAAAQRQSEAIQRTTRGIGGLVPTTDAERDRILALQSERDKAVSSATERDESGAFKMGFKAQQAAAAVARMYQDEIEKIQDNATRMGGSAAWKSLPAEVSAATAEIERLDAALRGFGGGSSPERPARSPGSGRASAPSSPFDPLAPLGDRALPDMRAQNTSDLLRGAGDWANAPGNTRSNIPGGPGWGLRPDGTADTAPIFELASAWDYLGASMSGTVGRMAQSASDIGSIVTQSVGALTGALGAAATNMILSGDAGAKGLKKQAGNALAGISAQAFGYAALLTAFGVAAAIPGVGLILGMNAPGFFAAAGVMAGAGLGLAGAARALGADKIGAGSGGGNAASAGTSAPVGAGSSGPGMAGQTAPIDLHVYMGGDEVHDLTYRTARRREMSGSMSMPRVGVAA